MEIESKKEDIYKFILNKGKATTKELSDLFSVSEQTIRKYLTELESDKLINRFHGGAQRKSSFKERLLLNSESKKKICKEAAKFIEDGDYLYIDGGTTYYYLIDYISNDIKVTIVTSSIPIAQKVMNETNNEVILLGGRVQPITMETFSPKLLKEVSDMNFDKSFFGTSGFSLEKGITENNAYSIEMKKIISSNSKLNIIGGGSEKEGRISFQKVFKFSDIDIFISNKDISKDLKAYLKENLRLILV
ncbi:MAG: DeoR/GlpR family DNA-binding transcription regulator [Tissierellia bacterium]|nr:DeoR/GlpR family DNA-binding transcription regulator [Tissierellia bacterium]